MKYEIEKYAFCIYRRFGTNAEWYPVELSEVVEKLQKRIKELEDKLNEN